MPRTSLVCLAFALSALAFTAGISRAAAGPEFLVQFGESGTPAGAAGRTNAPRGVAIDPSNGHVYVADLSNQRVDEFTAWGVFVKAFGWGVADGTTAAPQTCTTTCFAGLRGAGAGEFNFPTGVAVDGSGDVYVADFTNKRVEKFDSAGNFLLMFGGGVNKTTGENVCTSAQLQAGNVCGAGTIGTGAGQFGNWRIGSFIVAASGTIFVGDENRIEKFNPDGTFKSEVPVPSAGLVQSLAIDPAGNFYISTSADLRIRKLSPSGTVLNTIASAVNGAGGTVTLKPTALATDALGNLYVVDELGTFKLELFKFDASGAQKASFAGGEITASTGIGTNEIGDVYVSNARAGQSYVRAYGPLPTAYGPPPPAEPSIAAEYARSVGTDVAAVGADINPHFFPTTYYVEYGTGECAAGGCTAHPAPPGFALAGERNRPYPTADVLLENLAADTTYHYRFVAVSETATVFGPDRTFHTYPSPAPGSTECPNQAFRVSASALLPDCRAYELVSPPRGGGEVAVPGGAGGLVDSGFSVRTLQSSAAGEGIAYPSFSAFAEPSAAPAASTYLSSRGAGGWSTENVSVPDQNGTTRDPVRGLSPDLAFGALVSRSELVPGAPPGIENLYLRDDASGALSLLTAAAPRGSPGPTYCVSYAGASAGFGHVIFVATGALTPDAPEAAGTNLYEWSQGSVSLVSVLPDGSPAAPAFGTGFGAEGRGCAMNENVVRNAISADGSRVFWTLAAGGTRALYARVEGRETIQLDAPQGGSGPAGGGRFWAASSDGSKVFFTSPNKLTADSNASGNSEGEDLYLYDFAAAPGSRLTDVTAGAGPGRVRGVLGAGEDGSHVYFVANAALSSGATAGQPNLYVWHAGEGLGFIATLAPGDAKIGNATGQVRLSGAEGIESSWTGNPSQQVARVTPDGRHLAFVSTASLTGYDNTSQASGGPASEVYLYDAGDGRLSCASCNPSGARPLGFSELPVWITPYEQPRYLSDGGGRLFFLSYDRLAPGDTNGIQDVYEFERPGTGSCTAESAEFNVASDGCVFLISSGRDGDSAFLLDASADGRDVFISTRARLVATDEGELYDVYDAREGGGFPAPPTPPAPCGGEACRSARQATPASPFPGSSVFSGDGNVAMDSCLAQRRRAAALSRRAHRMLRKAAGGGPGAGALRRKAGRLAYRARALEQSAKRCQSNAGRLR